MILLDTHIWCWLANLPELLSHSQRSLLEETEEPLAVSVISLHEVALLASRARIDLPLPIELWFQMALDESSISVVDLSREIIIESTRLPGAFHRDPADRIIVATSRILDAPLVTSDSEILKYEHVQILPERKNPSVELR
ncbi:MAG: type II toxin-antitoxin system VapC family toxin [Bacteroidota bacterium]|nr:type II toxin-antitoxin system VapC family toxin [Bacteroidota bacterium]MDP4233376.1 type II toxin-antitoxin system VapC family toxin [Bacteroidota bacterium]MDP4242242.1 type II toxin-antitoxin system VapC family toxin [Bacteroidota bacterium]MDP4286998.1 type II toxin-antitoxin system VapC family toxin [Bacteroidota bacterium]